MVREAINAVPTLLGRLLFISAMRDPNGETYMPWLVGVPFDAGEQTTSILGAIHRDLFLSWLAIPMEAQVSDAVEFLTARHDPEAAVGLILRGAASSRLLPPNAENIHKMHFLSEIQLVMELVRSGCCLSGQRHAGRL